jgi:hypothetical protein
VVERGRNHCGRAWLDGGPLVVPVRGGRSGASAAGSTDETVPLMTGGGSRRTSFPRGNESGITWR